MTAQQPTPAALVEPWRAVWPDALALWSRFTRLRSPVLCTSGVQARAEGLLGSFAMIRLHDQTVVIDLPRVVELGLGALPLEVLGHEIGHHVSAPASVLRSATAVARMRVALPGVSRAAPMLANIYADLVINDRLFRDHGLRLDQVYAAIEATRDGDPTSPLWTMYLRCYEILWALPRHSLARAGPTGAGADRIEGDAQLCARLTRVYAREWLDGAGRFAALCFPYLEQDAASLSAAEPWGDSLRAGAGADVPGGMTASDDTEGAGAIHPALDPVLSGRAARPDDDVEDGQDGGDQAGGSPTAAGTPARGSTRTPAEYGEIMREIGIDLSPADIAVRWYTEQALPHLVRFPATPHRSAGEVLPEGFRRWTIGEDLRQIDWLRSATAGPVIVPGLTTVQRVHGADAAGPPRTTPLDLDLYVDSSGSMPIPAVAISYPALAGAVMALSALRAGARVQVTLWSSTGRFQTTGGFLRDRDRVMRALTGHIGGGTGFPLNVLRDTYAGRDERDPPAHVLVVSDDGVDTMIRHHDEQGTPGETICRDALAAARGGGTLVLQLWRRPPELATLETIGFDIEEVGNLEELVAFARRFAARRYGPRDPVDHTGGRP